MARRIPVYQLEARLASARQAALFYANPNRNPIRTTVNKQSKTLYAYRSIGINLAATTALVEIQASDKSVLFFGNATALKLLDNTAPTFDEAIPKPRGFKPSMIHASQGDPTPTPQTSRATGKRYIKYTASNAGDLQSSYSAPVGATGTTGTLVEQKATAQTIANAKEATIGIYGRIYFSPESSSNNLI